jgi:hypothetical protein
VARRRAVGVPQLVVAADRCGRHRRRPHRRPELATRRAAGTGPGYQRGGQIRYPLDRNESSSCSDLLPACRSIDIWLSRWHQPAGQRGWTAPPRPAIPQCNWCHRSEADDLWPAIQTDREDRAGLGPPRDRTLASGRDPARWRRADRDGRAGPGRPAHSVAKLSNPCIGLPVCRTTSKRSDHRTVFLFNQSEATSRYRLVGITF